MVASEETNYEVVVYDNKGNELYRGPAKKVTIEGSVNLSAIKGGKADFVFWFPYK